MSSDRAVLFFNRDERKDRPRAKPPSRLASNDVARLAPIDPAGGGTWIAVNEFGLCCFLLNNYEEMEQMPIGRDPLSRGALPLQLTDSRSIEEAVTRLETLESARFRPFFVGLLSLKGLALFSWSGTSLKQLDIKETVLTTSSFRSQEVQAYRKSRYAETVGRLPEPIGLAERRRYHTELKHEDSAFNPLMLREESETHNVCSIEIESEEVRFSYEERVTETFQLLEPKVTTLACH